MTITACEPGRRRRPSHLLALEPRMMFDAAAAVTAAALADAPAAGPHTADAAPLAPAHVTPDADHAVAHLPADTRDPADAPRAVSPAIDRDVTARTVDDRTADLALDAPRTADTGRQYIFIDTSVADYKALAAQWADQGTVVLIDAQADGLDQVRAALAGQSDVSAIHIISHGAEGVLWLGTTRIDQASIDGTLAASLGAVGRALAPGGDILLYGCDFAEGVDGAAALQALADATHADVAASTDLTGDARLGGDWTLEAHDGAIQAAALSARDWDHTLDPDQPVPIAVTADSLTVTYNNATVVSGSTGYGTDSRSPDVGVGAVARWTGAASYQGQSLDLVATVVSLTTGDAVRFNRPTSTTNGENPTFLLRDLTGSSDAQVQLQWSLVLSGTNTPVSADVEFGILDIDGIGGQPFTRESVSASTQGLAYYSREQNTDIYFQASAGQVTASGTQNENTDTTQPLSTASEATFDWKSVSTWTLTYTLATNNVTTQAQFYQDGNFDFHYTTPVYTSIPRLDLDANDSTASGNDAHFTFVEKGSAVQVVDTDVRVTNPMPANAVTGAAVTLTNAKPNDQLLVGTLPSGITAATATNPDGSITVTLTGAGSESAYDQALQAITFTNTGTAPDPTQRVIAVSFHNDTLTSAVATSRIDVVPINDPPQRQGTLADQATSDSGTVSYPTAQAFVDPDNDALTYSATGLPAGLTIDATGVISGTLGHSASQANGGQYAITVTATDPSRTSTTQSFALTVTNPPPVAQNDTATVNENTSASIAVLANDSDPDSDPLTVTSASAQHGSVSINPDGTLTYTPTQYYYGPDSIAYAIADGDGGTSSATVAVTVAHVNQAPVATTGSATYSHQDGDAVNRSIASSFSDIDGDALSYTATGLPAGLTLDAASGVIAGTIDRSASQVNGGVYTVVLKATDPSGASATRTVTIDVTNPAPTAQNDSASTNENTPVTIPVLANDHDPDGDPLTVTSASAQHGTVAINGDGTLTYTPGQYYYGADTISYAISDGQGGTSSATVAVAVAHMNQAPVSPYGPIALAAQDGAAVSVSIAPSFSDPDGDTLTYGATGLPTGLALDPTTGVIAGTIDRSASQVNGGIYTVVVTATDPSGASATRTGTLTVTNPPPVAQNDTASTAENTPITFPVLDNDSDPDGDPLLVTAAMAQHGTVSRNPDGTLTYTPDQYFNGTDTISYTISDGQGGTSSAAVTMTVAHVNQPPQPAGTLPDRSAADAGQVSIPTAGGFGDPDGDALTYSASGLPAGVTIDAATGVISGPLDRSASQVNGGHYAIQVTATDPSGLSDTQAFQLTVTNPAPAAQNDTASTDENTPVTVTVLFNDNDPDGDPLTVTGASAQHGSVAINPDGTLTYMPTTYFNGADTISYAISDGEGGTSSATVAVNVAHVNQAPQPAATLPDRAAQDAEAVSYATASAFADPDGDRLTYSATGLPAGLSIDAATGVIAGTLDRAASQPNGGAYAVVVTATDPSGLTATRSFQLTVTNPPPVATDDASFLIHPGDSRTVTVLANDSDPDGDPLTVIAASAQHGTVAINGDGTLTYTADPAYAGADTIAYTIGDGNGGSASAQVPVSVGNTAPTADPLPAQAATDAQPVSLPLAGAFHDIDGDTLTYSATGLPTGLFIDASTGVISGTIDHAASQLNGGTYVSTVTADDGHGGTATASLGWTVTNPAPVATDDAVTTPENVAVTIPVLANDHDPDGDPLTVTTASAQHGSVAINADGTLTYTPTPYYFGTDTIAYTISDGEGGTSNAQVAVTVPHVNQPPQPVGTLPSQQASDGGTLTFPTAPGFTDVDGDTLTYSASGLPAGLSIDPATGIVSGQLPADASLHGPYAVTITATDASGLRGTQPLTIAVTHPAPLAAADRATTPQEVPITLPVLANDTSPSGAPLTIASATAPHGTVAINGDGTLTYTPAYGFRGTDTIRYTVTDPEGGTSAADVTVTVTVTPVNHPPAVTAAPPARTGSDGAPVRLDLGGYFADRDGDPLTYSATGLPAGLSIDPHTGVISGTAAHDASRAGPYHVTVTATDSSGAATSSSFDWSFAHPAPVAADDAAATAAGRPTTIAVLANDSDAAGDALSVTAASAANGTVSVDADGTLHYAPSAGFTGQDVVTYTVTDSDGATATGHVLVTVTPPPVAADGVGTTLRDTSVVFPLPTLAVDPAGLPLTVTAASADHGTVAVAPDGTLTYTPGAGFTGADTIRYTVTDPNGGTASALVTVQVVPPNQPPVVPGRAPIDAVGGQPLRLDLLAGVTDPDGDAVTLTGASSGVGRLDLKPDGTVTFTAPLGFTGATTITFTVSDGRGGITTDTLVVRVADGRGADIEELLRIGTVRYINPLPDFARVVLGPDGESRNPLALLRTVEAIAPLGTTVLGAHPIGDVVNDTDWLGGTDLDPVHPVTEEVARLNALAGRPDGVARTDALHARSFGVRGFSGFSAASDAQAGVMVEAVIRGDALYVEVRDTAGGRLPAVCAIDVRLADGTRPDWLRVDPRGLAIIERAADADELHLVIRVTRTDGRTATTRVAIQGATGEIELDRRAAAPPLHATLHHPAHALHAEAHRLARHFK